MSDDFDRLLRESLSSVRAEYERERALQRERAAARLTRRLRRHRLLSSGALVAGGVTLIALVAVVAVFTQSWLTDRSGQAAGLAGDAIRLDVSTDPHPRAVGSHQGLQWVGTSDGIQIFSSPRGHLVGRVDVGGRPSDLRLTSTDAWVTVPSVGQLVRIDPQTHAVRRYQIVQRASTMSLSVSDFAVWVVADSNLFRIDIASGRIGRVPVQEPLDVAAQGSQVWALTTSGLQKVDAARGRAVGRLIPNPTSTGDVFMRHKSIYLASSRSDQIVEFKGVTRKFKGRFAVTGTYVDMAISGKAIWVLSRTQGEEGLLTPVDPGTFTVLAAPIHLNGSPAGVTADLTSVWVTEGSNDRLIRIDQATALGHAPK